MLVLVYSVGLTAIEAQEGHLMSFRSCAVGESTRCVESKKFCAYIVTPVFIFHISILHMTSTYYVKHFVPCFAHVFLACTQHSSRYIRRELIGHDQGLLRYTRTPHLALLLLVLLNRYYSACLLRFFLLL